MPRGLCAATCDPAALTSGAELYDKAASEAEKAGKPLAQLTIFSQSPYGVPIAVMGMVYIVLLGRRILPGHVSSRKQRASPCCAAALVLCSTFGVCCKPCAYHQSHRELLFCAAKPFW